MHKIFIGESFNIGEGIFAGSGLNDLARLHAAEDLQSTAYLISATRIKTSEMGIHLAIEHPGEKALFYFRNGNGGVELFAVEQTHLTAEGFQDTWLYKESGEKTFYAFKPLSDGSYEIHKTSGLASSLLELEFSPIPRAAFANEDIATVLSNAEKFKSDLSKNAGAREHLKIDHSTQRKAPGCIEVIVQAWRGLIALASR